MYTNQDVAPHASAALHACAHPAGRATLDTCRYLRALDALRAWADRSAAIHNDPDAQRESIGALWLLQAELAYAHDHCPNTIATTHERSPASATARATPHLD
jgi:hypothetical protein